MGFFRGPRYPGEADARRSPSRPEAGRQGIGVPAKRGASPRRVLGAQVASERQR